MADTFFLHESNPNDEIGGGGCLASGRVASEDCSGRWIHFHRVSTEFNESPYAVICERHYHEVLDQIEEQEPLPAGDVLPLRETKRVVSDAGDRLAPMGAREHVTLG